MPRLARLTDARSSITLAALLLGSTACDPFESLASGWSACGSGQDAIASVSVQPTQVTLRRGDVVELSATRIGSKGESILLCPPTWGWDDGDPAVATVSGNGERATVRAVGAGTTVISARSGGKLGSTTVTVDATPIASLTIEPSQLAIRMGHSARLSVTGRDSAGRSLTINTVSWSSDDNTVATISSTGVLVGVALGTARIRASVEHVTVVAQIPVTADAPVVRIKQISAGYQHTCAIAGGAGVPEGSIYCWGDSGQGESGAASPYRVPKRIASTEPFVVIAAGQHHTCGIATSGTTYCWAGNSSMVPVPSTRRFRSLALVAETACGLDDGGVAYCWGRSLLGSGSSSSPVPLPGGLRFAELIGGGWSFMCGRTLAKQLYCWGTLPTRTPTTPTAPTLMSGSLTFEQVDAGTGHACGVVTSGDMYCWGYLGGGHQLPPGAAALETLVPTRLDTPIRFRTLGASDAFTCGLSDEGAFCMGGSRLAGAAAAAGAPHRIPGESDHPFTSISGGGSHACAIDTNGGGWCWGRNYEGQLGSGDPLQYPATPLPVVILQE